MLRDNEILSHNIGYKKYISTPYFNHLTLCEDGLASYHCSRLKDCLDNGYRSCNSEWETYTSNYCREFGDEYNSSFPVLEQYQITLNDSTVIQPNLLVNVDEKHAGTHIIIGNGELPKYFTNTNVFDSAYMVVTTCDENKKYVVNKFFLKKK